MATVKLILERSNTLKDGSYSVVFQIIHRRARRLIYTPYKVQVDEFCSEKERVIFISNEMKNKSQVNIITRKINKQRKSINSHILELERRGVEYHVEEISSRYRIEHDSLSLLGYFDMLIERKQEMSRLGTMKSYKSTRASLSKFLNRSHARISDVDFTFVREYEQYLISSGITTNTICFYLRNFKSVYNQAVIDGFPLPEKMPFKYVQAKAQKTTKRALDREDLIRIRDMDLSSYETLTFARDIFLFSFYSRGMAMVDILHLTRENTKKRILSYRRKKTNQYIEMSLTKELLHLIEKYKGDSEYLFPILNSTDPHRLRRLGQSFLNKTNRHLNKIGEILELNIELTTYVARHSWATQAKQRGVAISVISEGLGHTSEKTTQIYLKAFERSTLDKLNGEISSLL